MVAQDNLIPELRKKADQFVLHYRENRKKGVPELRLTSTTGRHVASHTHFNLLDEDGNAIASQPITYNVAKFIFDNFERRGDTESFNIFASDLQSGALRDRSSVSPAPGDVRHKLTRSEHSFTATGDKLDYHWPIFKKLKETGYGSIIRATMTNHQLCSSHCQYCSTISRNRSDSISLEEAKAFVTALYDGQADFNRERFGDYNDLYKDQTGCDIRLRGLILSGGGQPNLWPYFEAFVAWLGERDIDIGLITNGFPRKIDERVYTAFKWIRISITPEDASPHYRDGRFDRQPLPESIRHNPNLTVGYSYVHGPWTTDDLLLRIGESLDSNGFDYCRVLTDCNLARTAQLRAHQDLAERLHRLGLVDTEGNPTSRIFHQLKYHGTPDEAAELWQSGQCFLQSYNVFWDTTGHDLAGQSHCYPCDSITVLAEEQTDGHVSVSERRFNPEKWGTVTNTEVAMLYEEPIRPYFDPRDICASCLFMRNNAKVKSLIAQQDLESVKINPAVQHLNFP